MSAKEKKIARVLRRAADLMQYETASKAVALAAREVCADDTFETRCAIEDAAFDLYEAEQPEAMRRVAARLGSRP